MKRVEPIHRFGPVVVPCPACFGPIVIPGVETPRKRAKVRRNHILTECPARPVRHAGRIVTT